MHKRGFTLIEILVVLGIISLVLFVAPVFDLSFLKKESVQSDARAFIQNLQKARSDAMNNIDGENHSVSVGDEQIIFERLTGNVSREHEIVLGTGKEEIKININHEGGIDW